MILIWNRFGSGDFDLKSLFSPWFWFWFQIILKMILPNTDYNLVLSFSMLVYNNNYNNNNA